MQNGEIRCLACRLSRQEKSERSSMTTSILLVIMLGTGMSEQRCLTVAVFQAAERDSHLMPSFRKSPNVIPTGSLSNSSFICRMVRWMRRLVKSIMLLHHMQLRRLLYIWKAINVGEWRQTIGRRLKVEGRSVGVYSPTTPNGGLFPSVRLVLRSCW